MKTLTLDLNKLTKEQLQAYMMLEEVAGQHKIQDDNKGWQPKEPLPKMEVPPEVPNTPEVPPDVPPEHEVPKGTDETTDFIA